MHRRKRLTRSHRHLRADSIEAAQRNATQAGVSKLTSAATRALRTVIEKQVHPLHKKISPS
jgi:hypothetical protein